MQIKICIQYKGTEYVGWQRQKNGLSIQEILEKKLKKILKENISLVGSGRTDAGVHALNQIAVFKIIKKTNLEGLKFKLNKLLPEDIKVLKAEKVSDSFHPQFGAKNKTYIYKIKTLKELTVFEKNLFLFYKEKLDLDKLQNIINYFKGVKDFQNYTKKGYSGKTTIRKVENIKIIKRGVYFTFTITGNGFLRGMVRLIVGAILNYSKGSVTLEEIKNSLKKPYKKLSKNYSVPPHGLYLKKVRYR